MIEEQRRRLAELKQRAVVEAQSQWEALHGPHTQLAAASSLMAPPLLHHSILHHQPPPAGERPYDTLSLESSDSLDTSVSTGDNSACSPDNSSRFSSFSSSSCLTLLLSNPPPLCLSVGLDVLKIEEMEKLLREAQQEKARLIESRVRRMLLSPRPNVNEGTSSQQLRRML